MTLFCMGLEWVDYATSGHYLCVLYSQFPKSRVSREASNEIASYVHMMSHPTTIGNLLNDHGGREIVSLLWSCDVLLMTASLSDGVASPSCGC